MSIKSLVMNWVVGAWVYITYIIQMQILQRFFLRRQRNTAQLKHSLAMFKLHQLTHQQPSPNLPLEVQNKQLYLQYMEEVLHSKEQELIELEEELQRRAISIEQAEGKQQVLNPLALSHQAEVLARQAQMLSGMLGEKERGEVGKGMRVIEQACRKNYIELQEQMMRQYEEFTRERRQLSERLSKLGELEKYQKYLMQLQHSLEDKEYSILVRERELGTQRGASERTFSQQPSHYMTQQSAQDHPHDTTTRSRRNKIFGNNPNGSSISQQYQGGSRHMQSSQIMQGEGLQMSPQLQNHKYLSSAKQTTPVESDRTELAPILQHVETQTDLLKVITKRDEQQQSDQDQQQAMKRLKQESHFIRFIRLWLRYSDRAARGGLNHHKTMALYSWRLNTIYDQTLYPRIKANLQWPNKLPIVATHLPHNINYPQLSLKKKMYLQKFWNHQQRKAHKQRVLSALKSVVRSRNRRERTAVVLYFRKFQFHAQLLTAIKVMLSNMDNAGNMQKSGKNILAELSRLNSSSMSRVEHKPSPTPVAKENKKNTQTEGKLKPARLNPNSASSSSQAIRISQSKSRIKSSSSELPNTFDMEKLKEYIRSQEEIESRLAIECAQTEAVFRLASALSSAVGRHKHCFWTATTERVVDERIVGLERAFHSQEFKWELFMAKARLALTNNTNKVSHLEQLLAFIGNDK